MLAERRIESEDKNAETTTIVDDLEAVKLKAAAFFVNSFENVKNE